MVRSRMITLLVFRLSEYALLGPLDLGFQDARNVDRFNNIDIIKSNLNLYITTALRYNLYGHPVQINYSLIFRIIRLNVKTS